ncbi:hypothetical protein B0G75_109216 [Paraburkholderia sp. BL18I3N2]|nr:hypothetical protein B0G75_109216 [Paraburkholderia sp. BL18I3N2]
MYEPALVVQQTVIMPERMRNRSEKQARHSRAATAARPVMPEMRHAACGFFPFTYPKATRKTCAGFRFDTGHSL